jgi:hypothetical protein
LALHRAQRRWDPEALRHSQSESVQDRRLHPIRSHDAPQSDLAITVAIEGQYDVGALDRAELSVGNANCGRHRPNGPETPESADQGGST